MEDFGIINNKHSTTTSKSGRSTCIGQLKITVCTLSVQICFHIQFNIQFISVSQYMAHKHQTGVQNQVGGCIIRGFKRLHIPDWFGKIYNFFNDLRIICFYWISL